MLIDYIPAAMRRAHYDKLPGNEGFAAQIRGFKGLIGCGRTLEACREDLYGALQSWLVVKLRHADRDLPVVDGINLIRTKPRARTRRKSVSAKAA